MIDEISLTPDAEGHLSLDVDSSQRNNAVDVPVAWNDPVNFVHKRVDSTLINLLINKPYQPDENYTFPKTNGRSCLHAWFRNTLPDGTTVKRRWLSYSAKEDKCYCINCILFGTPSANKVWTTEGFNGWKQGHGQRGISSHETSELHRQSEIAYIHWTTNMRIDTIMVQRNQIVVEQNRRVVSVAIQSLQYLCSEMLAIRGHNSAEGKFINLFKLLSQYEPVAASYLELLNDIRSRDTKQTGRKFSKSA